MKRELAALFSFFAYGFYMGQETPRTDAWLGFGTLMLMTSIGISLTQVIRRRKEAP